MPGYLRRSNAGRPRKIFSDGKAIRYNLVVQLLRKLERIAEVLKDALKYCIYGSSLLVVYNADEVEVRNGAGDGAEEQLNTSAIYTDYPSYATSFKRSSPPKPKSLPKLAN